MGRELIIIENFWCLLPKPARSKALKAIRDELLAMQKEYLDEMLAKGPHARCDIVRANHRGAGGVPQLAVELTQQGILPWPEKPANGPLTMKVQLRDRATERSVATFETELPVSQLECDILHRIDLHHTGSGSEVLSGQTLFADVAVSGDTSDVEMKFVTGTMDVTAILDESPASQDTVETSRRLSGAAKDVLKTAKTDLKSREFFLQFSRTPKTIGLEPISNSNYRLSRPDGTFHEVRSMLSTHEIALCYALAALNWNGDDIVDLGPLMGASSWAFAKGLSDAGQTCETPPIHSFDLWKSFEGYQNYLSRFPTGGAASVLGQWTRTVEGYHHLLEPHQGDFLDFTWDGRPIGILFVDLAKSVALNNHVIRSMFPCLRPGAILIQQDYVHFNEYWIHMEMARLRDFFEPCYTLRGATQFYRCITPVPQDVANASSSELPYEEQVKLLDDERARAIGPVQEVLKCAAAKYAIDFRDFDRAQDLLSSVSVGPLTENGVQEFSGIARSNKSAVESLLEKEGMSKRPSKALR